MNGSLKRKNETAHFIPWDEQIRFKEDQIFFEGLDQEPNILTTNQMMNKGRRKTYHERYNEKVKIARILGCVAAICIILLLASISVIAYLTVQLSFVKTKPPVQTAIATVTSVYETTSSYESTTTVTTEEENVTSSNIFTTLQVTQPLSPASAPVYETTSSYESTTTVTTEEENVTSSNIFTILQVTQPLSPASAPDPIVFVLGKFTFSQASEACSTIGRNLALKEDMEKAFQKGYERCRYGWLGDSHAGYVMQKSGARPACGGGIIGLIYTPYKDPQSIVGGAYCAPINEIPQIEGELSTHNKSINWWATLDPADVYDLRYLLQMSWRNGSSRAEIMKQQEDRSRLLESFRFVYPCCNFINIAKSSHGNSTIVDIRIPASRMKRLVELYKEEFKSSKLKVYPHLIASHEALITNGAATFNRSQTIDDIVSKATLSGVDGLVMEYEPHMDYTRSHAEIYRDFLDELSSKLSQHQIKLGMVVASWGILKYYDVYSKSTVDIIGSMSSTYYGHDITSNINHVNEMMKWIDLDRLQIGIGAMHMSSHVKSTRSFRWNQKQLMLFVDWLKRKGVNHLHIWPEKWGESRWVERFFINAIVSFTK